MSGMAGQPGVAWSEVAGAAMRLHVSVKWEAKGRNAHRNLTSSSSSMYLPGSPAHGMESHTFRVGLPPK